MSGTLYGVGVGPGDPSLLTLKAVELLRAADVIAFPDTGGEQTALGIVKPYIEGKPVLECPSPMTKDRLLLQKSREEAADRLCKALDAEKTVVFITLGDPTVYSTYAYLHRLVKARGYAAQMVPGVPSFCAVAATLDLPLCEGGEALHICPAAYGDIQKKLTLSGNVVFMKAGSRLQEIKEQVQATGRQAGAVSCCGMPEEKRYAHLEEASASASYFTTVVVKGED